MTGQIDTTDTEHSEGIALDRRSLLVKAAAVGAIAWTVPLVVSSPALASSCTPSCAVGSFSPSLIAKDVCSADFAALPGYNAALAAFIGNSNKMAVLSIVAPAGLHCPCGTGAPNTIIGNIPAQFGKAGTKFPADCSQSPGSPFVDTYSLTGTGYTDPSNVLVTDKNSFLVGKSGAIPTGVFRGPTPICVSVGCKDARNRIVYHKCSFTLCYSYSPSGSCGTYATIQALFGVVANSCAVGCNPC